MLLILFLYKIFHSKPYKVFIKLLFLFKVIYILFGEYTGFGSLKQGGKISLLVYTM